MLFEGGLLGCCSGAIVAVDDADIAASCARSATAAATACRRYVCRTDSAEEDIEVVLAVVEPTRSDFAESACKPSAGRKSASGCATVHGSELMAAEESSRTASTSAGDEEEEGEVASSVGDSASGASASSGRGCSVAAATAAASAPATKSDHAGSCTEGALSDADGEASRTSKRFHTCRSFETPVDEQNAAAAMDEEVSLSSSRFRTCPSDGKPAEEVEVEMEQVEEEDEAQRWVTRVPEPIERLERYMPSLKVATRLGPGAGSRACVARPANLSELPLDALDFGNLQSGSRCFVFGLVVGKAMFMTLNHAEDDIYDSLLEGDCLDSLKLITQPLNLPVEPPLKGPQAAETLAAYFGRRNAVLSRQTVAGRRGKVECTTLAIDMYSVFTLRLALPTLLLQVGRMCDFHIVDCRHNAVLAGVRMRITQDVLRTVRDLR
eukprot:TRINITY_DN24513_c0_g1_i1.p1 TRINITY_DN24513_c0_g1~~TRINITY_DN24513_c0_g1_i1.p1  ORF type:complete len:437 (+),score=115.98 TRINITY_DN24513_c0_g1_i1:146-1456(+)